MTDKNSGFKLDQSKTHTFSIDFASTVDNKRYEGQFTCKRLSIRDVSALGVRKAQLNGGMYFDPRSAGRGVDEATDTFNNMIAHLEVALIKVPTWWDLDSISDMNLIGTVFQEVLKHEESLFRAPGQTTNTHGSGEVGSGTQGTQTNSPGVTRSLVEQEVSAALKP